MPLRFRLKSALHAPVQLPGLTPQWTRSRSAREIGAFEVSCGNKRLPLGDLFAVAGNSADGALELAGDLSAVHGIGAGMTAGTIRVDGHVGDHAGAAMRAGSLEIRGNAGNWLGREMRGGRIHVHGSVAEHAAAAPAGASRGMCGGELLIAGSAGHGLGRKMRRGLVAVSGSAGDDVGSEMLAGTILIGGSCGKRPGTDLRRGTLALIGPPPELPLTYVRGNRFRPQFLELVLVHLRRAGMLFPADSSRGEYLLHHGDMLVSGRGEILIRA